MRLTSYNLPKLLVQLVAVQESQQGISFKSHPTIINISLMRLHNFIHLTISIMSPSNVSKFLLVMVLLALQDRTMAQDGSTGFHGYERDALLALKKGFNDSFLNRNWTGIMCYMNDTPYWHGVQCFNGRVTGVTLESMNLIGEIEVDALVNLTELSTLSLKNNSILGRMMDFTYNHKLRNIDLSNNSFSAEISSSLVNLKFLQSLELHNNNLTGPVPGFNQSSLKTFNVSYNNFSGEIPKTRALQSFAFSSYIGNENLCGPPTPTFCNTRNDVSESNGETPGDNNSNSSRFVPILIAVNVIVLVVILFLFIIYYKKYKKLKKEINLKNLLPKDEEHDTKIVNRAPDKKTPEGDKGKLVFIEGNNGTTFELDDLLRASAEGLGKGNFGNCYKAMLEIGQVVVVKRLRDLKPLNKEEFMRQVRSIGDQKHQNLLPLLAFYYSKDEKLFLYKFAAHGNVFNRLHGERETRDRVPFRWSSRLAVARGVARALEHLHLTTRSTTTTAPHGNLKSSNVLLDEHDEILVSDYGLASLISLPIAAQRMVSYKSPEYQSHKKISKKSDIWSYGCLLLELLTGRVSSHSSPPGTSGVDLCGWVHRAVREEWTAEIFDAEIAVQRGANQGMLRLMQIAMRCCDKSPEKRPEIGRVAAEVEEIKVSGDSEDEGYEYSSFDRSMSDDSYASTSIVSGDDQR